MLKRILDVKDELISTIGILESNGVDMSQTKLTTNDWTLLKPVPILFL